MQKYMAFELFHLPPNEGSKINKLLGYFRQAAATLKIIKESKPEVVWIQLPPNFIVHILLIWRFLSSQKFKIILDLHNAALRRPWVSIPLFGAAARASNLLVVHNEEILQQVPRELLRNDKSVIVLEDPPSSFEGERPDVPIESAVLIPCSFHDDEPIDMLLAAARLVPEIGFRITGRIEKAQAKGYLKDVPDNVQFTGFVSENEFNRLLHSSAVVAGVTTYEGIQLSVASEAVGAGKALILSSTRILRSMFSDCAIFFENNEQSFADAVTRAVNERRHMEMLANESLDRRVRHWQSEASRIQTLLHTEDN